MENKINKIHGINSILKKSNSADVRGKTQSSFKPVFEKSSPFFIPSSSEMDVRDRDSKCAGKTK